MTHKLQGDLGRQYITDEQRERIRRDSAQAMRDAARAEYIAKRQGGHTADRSPHIPPVSESVRAATESVDRLQSAQTGSNAYRAFLARRHGRFS